MGIIARFKNWLKEQIEFEMYDAKCRMEEAQADIKQNNAELNEYRDKACDWLNSVAKALEEKAKKYN